MALESIIVDECLGADRMKLYEPTKGDKAFVEHVGANPMDNARLLRKVSDDYLSALISDNSNERSKSFQEQVKFEVQRRNAAMSRTGTYLRAASLAVSLIALVISGVALWAA